MRSKNTDTDSGWAWFVLVAVYSGTVILSTTVFMGGVIYVALLEDFEGSDAKTSLVGALNGGLLSLLGPFASIVMMTFSCRACILVGGLLITVSCLVSGFVTNVDILIITYGIIGGIGNSLTSTPFVVVLGYYFDKYRNITIAVSQAIIGLGFFLASPLAIIILNGYGLRGTFLILGAINAHICVVAMVCKPSSVERKILAGSRKVKGKEEGNVHEKILLNDTDKFIDYKENQVLQEANDKFKLENDLRSMNRKLISMENCDNETLTLERKGLLQESDERNCALVVDCKIKITQKDNKTIGSTDHLSEGSSSLKNPFDMTTSHENKLHLKSQTDINESKYTKALLNLQLMKNFRFIMFLLSTLSWNFTLSLCAMHLPNYMSIRGAGDVEISAIMTCFSVSNLAGRFIAAMTVDKGGIDSLTLHVGMLGVGGLVSLLFPFYSGAIGDYVFATLIGLYTGGPNSIMTPITLKMVRIEDLSTAHGLEYFFCGLGYVPGPFIAGLLYSITGGYEYSFICGGAVLILGCVLAMISAIKLNKSSSE